MRILACAWRKCVKSQGTHSGRLFCGPTLGHRTSRVQSTNANRSTVVFGLKRVDLIEFPENCLRRTVGVHDKHETWFSFNPETFVVNIFLCDVYLTKYMPNYL